MSAVPSTARLQPIVRRSARAGAIAVVAALVLSVLVVSPARAADYDPAKDYDASNGSAGFTWGEPYLWVDDDGDGLPDVGDEVVYPFELDFDRYSLLLYGFTLPGTVASGSYGTDGWAAKVTVDAAMLAPDGSGPILNGGAVQFTRTSDALLAMLTVPAPPVLYPKATSIHVEVDEVFGDTTDGKPAEGDRVRYGVSMHSKNRGGVGVVEVGDFPLGDTGSDGVLWTFFTTWMTVTQADMWAGQVSLPEGSLEWTFADGTRYSEEFAPAPVETEAIASAYDADVSLQWRDATRTTTRGPGEGEVGDLIDYTFEMENKGNVTIDYAYLELVSPTIMPVGSYTSHRAGLAPGATLASSSLAADFITSDGGQWGPYVIEQADLDRGYVDFAFRIEGAANREAFNANPEALTTNLTKRVWLRAPVTDVTWTVEFELLDSNGDGVGQVGEQYKRTWTVANGADSEQAIEIDKVWFSGVPEDAYPTLSPALAGRVVNPGESASEAVVVDILDTGVLDTARSVSFRGVIDDEVRRLSDVAAGFAVGPYVAPTTTLDVSHSYVDSDGDGVPSIGDTVTFTGTVANEGTYRLMGIMLSDAASDVVGTLPPDASLAPGASLTWDVAHVLTAADFARGTLTYDVTVDADGLVQLSDNGTVASVAFAAFEADLTDSAEGGIAVCVDGKAVAELSPGDEFTVHAPDCAGEQLGGDDAVYVFSTPAELGTGAETLSVPADLELGAHRVAAYDSAGALIGWVAIDVVAAPVAIDAMPVTGPDGSSWTLAWVALLAMVLGGAAVALPRRR